MTNAEIRERIDDFMDELFIEFQNANGIETGDLPVDLSIDLSMASDRLAEQIRICMEWQNANK